jgi:flagellar biosynthesis protein FliR
MHAELHVPASLLIAFLLVLARMTGVFIFVPMPWKDAGPGMSRIALGLGSTLALFPRWPAVPADSLTFGTTLAMVLSDAALGAAIGLMVEFLSEALTFGAQTIAMQAGYGYASIIDPVSQADSDVLPVLAQLLGTLFFFSAGLHRYLIQVFADSLERFPPGSFSLSPGLAREVIRLGTGIFSTGLKLALPIVGLLLMTDITLGLLGRISPQLHLGMHSFPAKMLVTLVALASILVLAPALYTRYADEVFASIRHSFLH